MGSKTYWVSVPFVQIDYAGDFETKCNSCAFNAPTKSCNAPSHLPCGIKDGLKNEIVYQAIFGKILS